MVCWRQEGSTQRGAVLSVSLARYAISLALRSVDFAVLGEQCVCVFESGNMATLEARAGVVADVTATTAADWSVLVDRAI